MPARGSHVKRKQEHMASQTAEGHPPKKLPNNGAPLLENWDATNTGDSMGGSGDSGNGPTSTAEDLETSDSSDGGGGDRNVKRGAGGAPGTQPLKRPPQQAAPSNQSAAANNRHTHGTGSAVNKDARKKKSTAPHQRRPCGADAGAGGAAAGAANPSAGRAPAGNVRRRNVPAPERYLRSAHDIPFQRATPVALQQQQQQQQQQPKAASRSALWWWLVALLLLALLALWAAFGVRFVIGGAGGGVAGAGRCSAALEGLRDDAAFDDAVRTQAEVFVDQTARWRSGSDRNNKPMCYAVVATTAAACHALPDLSLQLASALQAQVNELVDGVEADPCDPLELRNMINATEGKLSPNYPTLLNRGVQAADGREQRSSPISVVVAGHPTVAELPGDVPFALHSLCDQTAAPVASNVYLLPVCLPSNGSGAAAAAETDYNPIAAAAHFKEQLRAELGPRLPHGVDLDALIARVGDAAVFVGDPGDSGDVDCASAEARSLSPACFHQSRLSRALTRFGAALEEAGN